MPKILDLFCGAGGAGMGYHQAGFDVVGVDIKPQPRYPFEFHQADALTFPLDGFDAIHASPPCQHYTQMLNHGLTSRDKHPDLIAETRIRISAAGAPYIIENVTGAASKMRHPVLLCGEMFGLRVIRHRLFECSFPLLTPHHITHRPEGAKRKDGDGGYYCRVYGHETAKREWGDAMGIDWMKTPELALAIPPAFTEFIGRQLMAVLERAA